MTAARTVLLATCREFPAGEPGAAALDAALVARGITPQWASWDDPHVDWAAADLVAVRSTWDYTEHVEEFLAWAEKVEQGSRVLNGAEVFAWNLDKAYLTRLGGLPVVPTQTADDLPALRDAVRRLGTAVVKPRTGAGGAGLLVVDDPDDPRLGGTASDHPLYRSVDGPWVVQPLVESVRTAGETSVFVLDGVAVAQVDKLPAAGEVRVHELFGGSSTPVDLDPDCAALAVAAMAAGAALGTRPLDYGRVDLLRLDDGALAVSELELIEPGLYLDVLPANAEPFAGLVAARLAG
jgi:glutathione synthase/RimK-type ligase-like ATP-grasp enzyme